MVTPASSAASVRLPYSSITFKLRRPSYTEKSRLTSTHTNGNTTNSSIGTTTGPGRSATACSGLNAGRSRAASTNPNAAAAASKAIESSAKFVENRRNICCFLPLPLAEEGWGGGDHCVASFLPALQQRLRLRAPRFIACQSLPFGQPLYPLRPITKQSQHRHLRNQLNRQIGNSVDTAAVDRPAGCTGTANPLNLQPFDSAGGLLAGSYPISFASSDFCVQPGILHHIQTFIEVG